MRNTPCPKCGSNKIIEDAVILEEGETSRNQLQVSLFLNPDAWIFKQETACKLSAWVCGKCGYTELYAENPKKLLQAYNKLPDADEEDEDESD